MNKNNFTQNSKLTDAIEYQTSSIVSRQILKKENGNITLFAFAENEELAKHTSPYDAFVLILEGKMVITLGDETHKLKEGYSVIMPANIPHALTAKSDTKMLLTMLK